MVRSSSHPRSDVLLTIMASVCADNDSEDHETIPLFDLSRMLWTNGSEYPPPDSDVLRLFFRFQLPDDIPPSLLDRTGPGGVAGVLYSLTTVAVRAGRFTKPWKQHTAIVIVPRDDVSPLLTQSLVTDAFAWRTGHKSKQVRRALWGDYATVRIEVRLPTSNSDSEDLPSVTTVRQLSIPDVPVFPLFTPVPFKVDVKTTTAKLTRRIPTDGRADTGPMQIFPTPPADASQFAFQLVRRTTVRVQKREETIQSVTACTPCEHVGVNVPSKEWVPMPDAPGWSHLSSNQERGVWVQRAQYSSKLVFNVPPTFSIGDRLAWEVRIDDRAVSRTLLSHKKSSTTSRSRCPFPGPTTTWRSRCPSPSSRASTNRFLASNISRICMIPGSKLGLRPLQSCLSHRERAS